MAKIIERLLDKIKKEDETEKIVCPQCQKELVKSDVVTNCYICTECGGYFRVRTKNRIRMVADSRSFEPWFEDMEISNPLDFPGYEQKLKKMGIHLLDNGRIAVDDDIEIAGFSIERYYYRRLAKHEMTSEYPKQKLGSCNEKRFQIMIAHNPEYFEAYAGWGADLTVSGHVHGGVMRLPFLGGVISPRLTLFPKYDGGMFEQNGRFMVVSRGLGTHTLPVRIFNPGELIMIELNPVGHMQ